VGLRLKAGNRKEKIGKRIEERARRLEGEKVGMS
jgi:hypothetical protein